MPCLPLPEPETARVWYTVTFVGQPIADFMSLQTTETCLRALAAGTSHMRGVRVRLGQQVSYSCFFEVLVLSWTLGLRPPWLDVRHTPATLYFVPFTSENHLPLSLSKPE